VGNTSTHPLLLYRGGRGLFLPPCLVLPLFLRQVGITTTAAREQEALIGRRGETEGGREGGRGVVMAKEERRGRGEAACALCICLSSSRGHPSLPPSLPLFLLLPTFMVTIVVALLLPPSLPPFLLLLPVCRHASHKLLDEGASEGGREGEVDGVVIPLLQAGMKEIGGRRREREGGGEGGRAAGGEEEGGGTL